MASDSTAAPLVVVGVDGSAESVAALRWAAGYVKATGATLRAVMAWHYPAAVGPAPVGVAPAEVTDDVRQHMQDTLDRTVAEVIPDAPDGAVETRISYGHPAQVLLDESEKADLLVVGNRGHGGFTGMLVGSVSVHLVSNAGCPVTVVRGR
ncbi:MAG: universal stress protein [Streptosporangiaceae bacterium]|jgi:nucleotide-binding universal stress UspA family protein